MSLSKYRRDMRKMEAQERKEAKARKLAKGTVQCECGRWLLDHNAYSSHVRNSIAGSSAKLAFVNPVLWIHRFSQNRTISTELVLTMSNNRRMIGP
jgi:hypothetical protein